MRVLESPSSSLSKAVLLPLISGMVVPAGEVVYWQPYSLSYWQGAVVVITNIPANSIHPVLQP
jgi:hypothetical protein